ncbi:hypothetical protein [Candidatus Sororendozoicomonas aggregata]|uniref:hypothetical protein n=1 Tax=Candidatus Sororendozoicomonas aggregata TaxID=3073239 RepID=UPI002ED63D28
MMEKKEDAKNPGLKNKIVFKSQKMYLGMPDKPFVIVVFFGVFGAGVIWKLLGFYVGTFFVLCYAALLLLPIARIHRDDPEAWRVWIKNFASPAFLTARFTRNTNKVVKVLKNGKIITMREFKGL